MILVSFWAAQQSHCNETLHSVLWGTVYHILICSTGMEDLRCYVS